MTMPKDNYIFDFDNQELDIEIDESHISKKILNLKDYVAAYVAVAGAQLFDAKTTTYRYNKKGFYLDVYLSQPSIGILFIKTSDQYTQEYLEKLKVYCEVYKIKLALVYLYSNVKIEEVIVNDDNSIVVNISDFDSIVEIDDKITELMGALLRTYLKKLYAHKEELNASLDRDLCKKLAIVFSLKRKEKEKKPSSFLDAYLEKQFQQ